MFYYVLKRLLFVIPTLLGIITINFFVVQLAPGGPVEQYIANMEGGGDAFMERIGSSQGDFSSSNSTLAGDKGAENKARRGLSPEILEEINILYGFDKPIHERYFDMLKSYIKFDFGESLFKASSVMQLIKQSMPVSITLGLWSSLIIYCISIPLGIKRAISAGSRFDITSGLIVVIASAIPAFLFAVLLIVLFAGGTYWQIFPLRGLHSIGYEEFSFFKQVLDYFHHIALPLIAMTIGGFAGLTMLTRNSFLDELGKQYVETAKSKGLSEKAVLYKHVFRNAMLIVISGLPATFVRMFFAGSLLIETVFSLNGLGLLGFEAAMQRDYPVMFSTLYMFTLIGLITTLIGDLTMMKVDPRIDFSSRGKV